MKSLWASADSLASNRRGILSELLAIGPGLAVDLPRDVKLEESTADRIAEDLVAGRIHAYFGPHPPRPFLEDNPNVARLFSDPQAEEERYLREEGYFPIMHVLAIKQDLIEKHPRLPSALYAVYEESRQLSSTRWDDPNWSLLVWGRHELERQMALCGTDPWQNGIEANRKNIERFTLYSQEQGLTRERLAPDDLFLPTD